jgi:hypothetical protein
MPRSPTISDLVEEGTISDAEVRVAVMAFMAGMPGDEFVIARGYVLDLTAAVRGHLGAMQAIADPEVNEDLRRVAVRTAILRARPEKR